MPSQLSLSNTSGNPAYTSVYLSASCEWLPYHLRNSSLNRQIIDPPIPSSTSMARSTINVFVQNSFFLIVIRVPSPFSYKTCVFHNLFCRKPEYFRRIADSGAVSSAPWHITRIMHAQIQSGKIRSVQQVRVPVFHSASAVSGTEALHGKRCRRVPRRKRVIRRRRNQRNQTADAVIKVCFWIRCFNSILLKSSDNKRQQPHAADPPCFLRYQKSSEIAIRPPRISQRCDSRGKSGCRIISHKLLYVHQKSTVQIHQLF